MQYKEEAIKHENDKKWTNVVQAGKKTKSKTADPFHVFNYLQIAIKFI